MPTIRLAHWHGGRPPGTELDVDDAELARLQHDGRVAALLPDKQEHAVEQPAAQAEEAVPEPEAAADEAEASAKSSRRRR